MGKTETYRETLGTLDHWDTFLLQESGLPGRRANLELAQAVAQEGDEKLFVRYISFDPEKAPTNSPYEFLAFCGVVGLGRLLSEGKMEFFETLRLHSSDPRWRIREAVAMALQHLGRVDMDALLQEMTRWSQGNLLEKRAAAAALCEPNLLCEEKHIQAVLQILNEITASIQYVENRKSDAFQALRKGLGYCWSVAVVASPDQGTETMEKWFAGDDRDITWIMKQNLKKKRLVRMDAAWVKRWQAQLGM
ncbi:MAG: hypothetical protein GY832_26455 [Chloroflexi bacterium]|nr:hypothetical protein [Chloroflexota bacterium]